MKYLQQFFLGFCFLLFLYTQVNSQNPNGIKLNKEEAFDGYTLVQNYQHTYLVNNCGRIVKTWEGYNFAKYHPKLRENGNLIFIGDNEVVELTWNGFSKNTSHGDPDLELYYEVIVLPNGNYLCVGRRNLTLWEFNQLGYNIPGAIPSLVDVVVEMDRYSGKIVWEWNIADHVIQERSSSTNNYGILSEHPELLSMDAISTYDWNVDESFMINGMDYNPDMDLIMLSVRKLSEVIIIDHSTTTLQAKGHLGGNHGKGGDILYRWGNPQNYGRGTADDRELYFQHNPHWIKGGTHDGKIMIFNNGLNRPNVGYGEGYSSVPVLRLPMDANGKFILEPDLAYGPHEPDIQYDGNMGSASFFSGYTSGATFLPNGNLFISEGSRNRTLELNPAGEIVWEYIIFRADYLFRSEKYPKNYSAFDGKLLIPGGTIENPSSSYVCGTLTSTEEVDVIENVSITVHNNPGSSPEIFISNPARLDLECSLYNIFGKLEMNYQSNNFEFNFELSSLAVSNYILHIWDTKSKQRKTVKIIKI